MASGTASWQARVRTRLRLSSWKRWIAVVLAFNIALGMGFSVVLLRHQVDARSRTGALLAQLDAAVWAQDAQLKEAAVGDVSAGTLDAAGRRVRTTSAAVDTALRAESEDAGALDRTVTAHGRAADRARTALAGEDDAARDAVLAELTTSGQAVHRAVAAVTDRHEDSTTSAGRVADFETLFMMVFAATMAGLLFRRFEMARRNGELRVAETKARGEARFRALVHHSSDVVTLTDAGLVIGYQTPSVSRLLGRTAEELAGTPLTDLVHPEDRLALLDAQDEAVRGGQVDTVSEVRLRHADGTWRHVHSVHTNLLGDPDVHAVVVTTRDVTAQKRLEAQLQHSAFHDALTGLANRALFGDRLEHALARSDRGTEPLAVLFVDLDDFKAVNDGAGHGAGDRLLVAVADRLRQVLRPGDTIARLGGDEFAVLLEGATTAEAEAAAERLLAALDEPFGSDGDNGGQLRIGASVGIAVGAAGQHDAAELLRHADVAMYAAKEAGKGRSAVFERDMDSAIIGQLRLKAELARALVNEEFTVYYQPTVELTTGRLAGVEALVRWEHPQRGLVPPAEFIPLAEQTGLIVPLGRFVLWEALRQMKAWHESYPTQPPVTVSVNLSARELEEPGLVASVRGALEESGLDPRYVVLEITESLLLLDLQRTVGTLADLRALGVRLAVDDFGTGYSSLAYLENLPVDILKIDKSFVDRIGEPAGPDDDDGAGDRPEPVMVSAISQLGHALHLQLVAEGIEQPQQATTLRGLGCQYGQGYYFSRPLPPDGLAALLGDPMTEPGWSLDPRDDAAVLAR